MVKDRYFQPILSEPSFSEVHALLTTDPYLIKNVEDIVVFPDWKVLNSENCSIVYVAKTLRVTFKTTKESQQFWDAQTWIR